MTELSPTPPRFLRDAAWLTQARALAYARLFALIALVMTGIWIATADGLVDRNGTPLGSDFLALYAGGEMALTGEAAKAYDPPSHFSVSQHVIGNPDIDYAGYYYPPHYFVLLAPLAALPYGLSFLVWMAGSFALALWPLRSIVKHKAMPWLAIGFPACFVNLGHGQNGFLSTALLGGGLVLLEKRPVLAGVCFGALTYKPQMGVLLPFVLLATGRISTIVSACVTMAAMLALSGALFGWDIFPAMLDMSAFARHAVMEQGGVGWHKLQSLFTAARAYGLDLIPAYGLQAALSLGVAIPCILLWRDKDAPYALKCAALVIGTLIATPYSFDYDLVLLGLGLAFLASHGLAQGFAPYSKLVIAAGFVFPILTRPLASELDLHIAPLILLALYGHVMWLARRNS